MRVAVTGGSGVVGAPLIRHLVAEGHQVRALARSASSAGSVVAAGAAPVTGDLLDSVAVARLVEGCEWVFHVAGINELCVADPALLWRVNVEGTEAMLEACSRGGVSRLVHTSSAVTVGERRGEVGRESTQHRGWYLSQYERSKHHAELLALDGPAGLDVVVVNPSSVQGPGRATGTGRILLAALRGKLPAVVDTTVSIVDIDDCARGHLLAAQRGRSGERYLLNGVTLGMREALAILGEVAGHPPRTRIVPAAALSVAASVAELLSKMAGRRPPLCREMARVLRFGHRYDGSKARAELGLEYTPVENTLVRAMEWFRERGLLDTAPVAETHEKRLAE